MAFVFLLSQVSLASGAGKAKADEVFDSLPLSAMILNEEQISNLSEGDKVVYLRALIYLGQVLETSQSQRFDYEVPTKYEPKKSVMNDSKSNSIVSMYWNLMVTESKAIIGAAVGWTVKAVRWGGARLATGSIRTIEAVKVPANAVASVAGKAKSGISSAAAESYAKRLAAAEAKGAKDQVKAIEEAIVKAKMDPADIRKLATTLGSKDGLKTSIITKLKDVKALEAQREVARTAGNSKEVTKLNAQIVKAKGDIARTENKYYQAGGSASEISDIYRKSNTTLGRVLASNVAEAATLGYLGYEGGKAMGYWGNAQIKLEGPGGKKIRDTMSSPEANKDPGKIIREAGYSCIYGGRASQLVSTEKGVRCKMPEAGQDKDCNVSNGKYLCPDYGFKAGAEPIQGMCIDIEPKKDLTQNCVGAFNTAVETAGEVTSKGGDEKAILEYNDSIRKLLTSLEGDIMTDVESKTHSFGYYCANSKKSQKSECNALTAFVNTLKDRAEIKKAIVAQADAAASASATSSSAAASSASPAGSPSSAPKETKEAAKPVK